LKLHPHSSAIIPLPALVLAVLCAMSGCAKEPEGSPAQGVVLITVDTLRADHLGSHGYPVATSPNIDALAKRGVLFRNASVQWPKTWASMASMLTGRYPKTTGLQLKPRVLPDSLLMLSEVFSAAGYATAAVVANFNVGRSMGFQQGFDHFVESWQELWNKENSGHAYVNEAGRVKGYTNATLVTDQALRWLDKREPSKPFFLWLHYMDPHGPYLPPAKYRDLFAGEHRSRYVAVSNIPTYQRQIAGNTVIDDFAHYEAQYDREIRYFDDELGRLLTALEVRGLGESVIALTADHGESLTEHGYYLEHGFNSYQPTAHVPLMIVQPGVIDGGRRIENPVALLDLAPTLTDLVGIEIPSTFEGVSWAPTMRGEVYEPKKRPVYLESGYDLSASQISIREGEWKLIHVRSETERTYLKGAEFELYNLREDPDETFNLVRRNSEIAERLRKRLHHWYFDANDRDELGDEVDLEALDPKSREMLKALGYIDADPIAPTDK
jgi:arylsulfatase A-like enzyme